MPREKNLRELGIESFGALLSAGVGIATKDPAYLLIAAGFMPVFNDMTKRMISPVEKSRIDRAESLAVQQIIKHIEQGSPVRKEFQTIEGVGNMQTILDGSINVARNSYEEKKITLIANLIATAPFTNTPLENMINVLQITERLTYRQLSILSIYAFAEFGFNVKNVNFATSQLSSYGKILDETFLGVYSDILKLMSDDILVQAVDRVVLPVGLIDSLIPSNIFPKYNGTLLINGLKLQSIPDEDTEEIRYFLDGDNLKLHGSDPTVSNPFKVR